ncbi:MAG: noncanonical pyrimidine nucleotidase, YjjG family, partial [Thermotogae bacterium]
RFEEFLKFLGINNIEPSVVANMYLEHLSQLAFFLTGAEEMLQKLKDSNQRMAVLTNGVKRVQHSRSKILNLGRYMEFVLTSEEAGKPKPDPALFILASKISGVPLNRSVYVGDDPVTDKQGAQNAGVDFILFDPKNTYNLSDIRVVHNFTELFDILSCPKTSKGVS